MSNLHYEEFDKIVEQEFEGNRYAAVNAIAKKARELSKSVDNEILESQAITWAITGKRPQINPLKDTKYRRKLYRPEDMLNYVEDKRIVKSVTRSLGQTKSCGHLIYQYNETLTEQEKARVRILVNMILDQEECDYGRN